MPNTVPVRDPAPSQPQSWAFAGLVPDPTDVVAYEMPAGRTPDGRPVPGTLAVRMRMRPTELPPIEGAR
jgi:hypothetical protein